ncbi:MAG: hypothetical protein DI535_20200 [Citrobacter freundii]|nr:MAG: hypothetical protein DI535_20200 [Citrobacter freundii]
MKTITDDIFSGDLNSARQWLVNGAEINSRHGVAGIYPIQSAINSSKPEVLQFVISNGADVNIENGLPLLEAIDLAIDGIIQNGLTWPDNTDLEMIRILLENGADPEIINSEGARPIDIIYRYAGQSVHSMEKLISFFRPLLPNSDTLLKD